MNYGNTHENTEDVEDEDTDVDTPDRTGDVLDGVADLSGGHTENFGSQLGKGERVKDV